MSAAGEERGRFLFAFATKEEGAKHSWVKSVDPRDDDDVELALFVASNELDATRAKFANQFGR